MTLNEKLQMNNLCNLLVLHFPLFSPSLVLCMLCCSCCLSKGTAGLTVGRGVTGKIAVKPLENNFNNGNTLNVFIVMSALLIIVLYNNACSYIKFLD